MVGTAICVPCMILEKKGITAEPHVRYLGFNYYHFFPEFLFTKLHDILLGFIVLLVKKKIPKLRHASSQKTYSEQNSMHKLCCN